MEDNKHSNQNSSIDIKQAGFSPSGPFDGGNTPIAPPDEAPFNNSVNITADNVDYYLIEALKKNNKRNNKQILLAIAIFSVVMLTVVGGMYWLLTLLAGWPG